MRKIVSTFVLILFCLTAYSQYDSGVEVQILTQTDTTTIGQQIVYPQYPTDEVTIAKVTIHPGFSTGWHKHTFPVFAYMMSGSLTVEVENNKTMQFVKNDSFSEVINTFHNGENLGNEDVVIIAFYMAGKGIPLSIKK